MVDAHIAPPEIGATRLGICITSAARATEFGPQSEAISFRIPITAKRSPEPPIRPAALTPPAWADSPGTVLSRTTTLVGELVVVEHQPFRRYVVRLGAVAILAMEDTTPLGVDSVKPKVIQDLGPLKPFDQVLLMQQFAGPIRLSGLPEPFFACIGGSGPLWFLGISADGTYAISDQIPFCAGKDPVIEREADVIKVTLPGGPVNRGAGQTPTETWMYEDGRVRKVLPGH